MLAPTVEYNETKAYSTCKQEKSEGMGWVKGKKKTSWVYSMVMEFMMSIGYS